MQKSLPNPWQLIRDTWKLFVDTWNESIKVSIWFLYAGLIYFTLYIAIKLHAFAVYPGVFVAVGILVLWSWATIRLIETCMRLDEGKKADISQEAMKRSWSLVLPLLWVGLLQLLVVLGSSIPLVAWRILIPQYLPGFVGAGVFRIMLYVLLLPPIYVTTRLSFSQLALIDQGKHGLEALAVSSEMVQGRWWDIFSRQAIAAVVFGGGIWVVLSILFLLLGYLVGPEKFILMSDPSLEDPLLRGVMSLIEGIVQAAAMPLIMIFVVKLYKNAKRTG